MASARRVARVRTRGDRVRSIRRAPLRVDSRREVVLAVRADGRGLANGRALADRVREDLVVLVREALAARVVGLLRLQGRLRARSVLPRPVAVVDASSIRRRRKAR